jgi:hypothetical protein
MPKSDEAGSKSGVTGPGGELRARKSVSLLLERFPHVQDVSLQLLEQNETFRELCEEYEACAAAAERLTQSKRDEALRMEYAALRLRLEGELLRYIEDHGGSAR